MQTEGGLGALKADRHIAFGVGEHFRAGARVATLELERAYKYLLPRREEVELAGKSDLLRSNLISGIKSLPIHLEAKPAWRDGLRGLSRSARLSARLGVVVRDVDIGGGETGA